MLSVLNASFLVERSALSKFDRVLEKVNAEVGQLMRFNYVGPLPPYSFAELRLQVTLLRASAPARARGTRA